MKILAIRGSNLASLAGDFEVNLDLEPLADVGLFAITGDTGAGKSTLLDAMCLALFGSYPRVIERRSDYVLDSSGDQLPSWSPGNILQRGKGRGAAEVDFMAIDGRKYRATWAIRRARGRANGTLQNPERTLLCIDDGSVCANSVRNVDAKVPELTGLNFDQFQRTVLLAQGQFDKFLEAKDSERGELLEKITGTEVYAQISKLLFDHCKTLRVELDNLRVQQQALSVLTAEERAAFERRRSELEEQIAKYQEAEQSIQQQLQFRTAVRQARVDLKCAEEGLSEAQCASTDAQATRDLLCRIDLVNPIRKIHDEANRTQNHVPSLKSAFDSSESELESSNVHHSERVSRFLESADLFRDK